MKDVNEQRIIKWWPVAFKEGYNFAVSNFGRLGGLSKSEAKTRAVRKNGKKGGRPKKQSENQ